MMAIVCFFPILPYQSKGNLGITSQQQRCLQRAFFLAVFFFFFFFLFFSFGGLSCRNIAYVLTKILNIGKSLELPRGCVNAASLVAGGG